MSSNEQMTWEDAVIWLRNNPARYDLVRACYFDDPLLDAVERFSKSEEWKSQKSILPKTVGKVLDLGAGRGITSYALAREGWKVCALEPDPSEIVGAEAIRSLVEMVDLDIEVLGDFSENITKPDDSFDLVTCRAALHHASDLKQTCREIYRVLKPGGTVVATREHVISRKKDLSIFLERHPLQSLYGGENAYLVSEYLEALSSAGLKVTKVIPTFASPINYSPMTEIQLVLRCTRHLSILIGEDRVKKIFSRETKYGDFLTTLLIKLVDWYNPTPGRPYSFVAKKEV